MCAILDVNVVNEVFVVDGSDAGRQFFKWINQGRGRLVLGGKLTYELTKASEIFRKWAKTARLSGKIRIVLDDVVNQRESHLTNEGQCQSNDPHVIALAQVSGARLLYTNDKTLQQDFKRKDMIDTLVGRYIQTQRWRFFANTQKIISKQKSLRHTIMIYSQQKLKPHKI